MSITNDPLLQPDQFKHLRLKNRNLKWGKSTAALLAASDRRGVTSFDREAPRLLSLGHCGLRDLLRSAKPASVPESGHQETT
jgi:hypothetical protein